MTNNVQELLHNTVRHIHFDIKRLVWSNITSYIMCTKGPNNHLHNAFSDLGLYNFLPMGHHVVTESVHIYIFHIWKAT